MDVTGWKRPPQRFHPSGAIRWMPRSSTTGEVMDSKSRFREVTKAHGLVEVGNDYLTNLNPPDVLNPVKQDIAAAIGWWSRAVGHPPVESVSDLTDEVFGRRMARRRPTRRIDATQRRRLIPPTIYARRCLRRMAIAAEPGAERAPETSAADRDERGRFVA